MTTPVAPHYSPAMRWGRLVFVSGQLPLPAHGPRVPVGDFDAQVRLALENLGAVLALADSAPSRVLRVTAYIVGIERWPAFNRVYAGFFGDHRPARTVAPVSALHFGSLVEIDAIALAGSSVSEPRGVGI